MDEKEARELLPKMISVFQKYRANAKESIGDGEVEREVLAEISPYIFGEKSPLVLMDAMEKSERIEAQSLWNLCYLIHQFIPEIVVAANILGLEIPEPELDWIKNEQWFR